MEYRGDLFMGSLGFTVIRFSQARATMQTPGIPDRRYYRPPREKTSRQNALGPTNATADIPREGGLSLWWEAKREGGKQSPFQRAFQELCEACGETYLVGTDSVLHDWAVARGLVERLPNGWRVPSPGPASGR